MIPQRVPGPLDSHDAVCLFAQKWMLQTDLAMRIQRMQGDVPFLLSIFSGYRTPAHQLELIKNGETTTPPELSTHCACPASGADLSVSMLAGGLVIDAGIAESNYIKNLFGQAATKAGLRWGGGAPMKDGIPVGKEWHHVDLGPRSAQR